MTSALENYINRILWRPPPALVEPRAWAVKFGNKRNSRPTDDDIVVNPCAALVLIVGFAHCPAPLPPEVSTSLWIEGKCRRGHGTSESLREVA
ncbi:PREDICTED: LSM8 homolog, U6 small nuclear RNA associated isoform X3 [Myotis davidii]|uniref:LSM8 homolog, U6 small nuclear RNA associated isoform X3 n=1 Tax=Myotis davidii TaxID=225400 RepID=UPI0007677C44|nr:PREDICTED: LSM8 homolog, U6 small nuclear RNA associated isoform X3 [Myotis davidii]